MGCSGVSYPACRRRRRIVSMGGCRGDWWREVMLPLKRAWLTVSAKVKAAGRKVGGGGILKLHNDVQTCGYQDVQVMWEMMLRRSEKKGKRPIRRLLAWSNRTS